MAIEKKGQGSDRAGETRIRARRFIDGAASTFTGRQGRRSTNCTAGAAASSRLRQRPRNPEVLPKKKRVASPSTWEISAYGRCQTPWQSECLPGLRKGQGLRSLVMGQEIGGSGGERETVSSCWIGDLRPTCKRASQIRVHVLYKRPEIPANKAIPAFAVSVTYRKH